MKIQLFLLAFIFLFSFQVNAQTEEEKPEAFWPKEIVTENYTVNIYQPQNETYSVEKNELVSRAAFSIKKNDAEGLVFGSMWINASLTVDRETRMMSLASVEVTAVRFPDEVEESKIETFRAFIEGEIPKWNIEFPQDELITSLEEVENAPFDQMDISPPLIVFSKEPSVLLTYDGDPSLKEIDKKYDRVINTAMFVIKEKKSGKYYLSGGDNWYLSKDPLGPWEYQKKVPKKIKKVKEEQLPKDESIAEEELDVPISEEEEPVIPAIVVTTKPTELIVIEGEAKFKPIQNTQLLFVENTDSDLFMNIESQQYFILLSGRWFTSSGTEGPWSFIASDQLPEDFSKIPEGSVKDAVLANVAGTDAAQEAKYDAQIPQTAAIDRATATASVEYDGDPVFENIEGISLQYAVNTSSSVFKSGDVYYLCDDAIWFLSDLPIGPWIVADERPEEIAKIPSSNPTYNVKYVYIYETTPTVVYVGYTPGYYGSYIYGPTVIYGTGFYYSGWYGHYYYPRPVTYGFSVRYNPWYGWSIGFGVGYGSPYGWYGYHGYYGPRYYRPPYYRRPHGGYYGHHARVAHRNAHYRSHYNRNAYHNRRGASQRPSTRPSNRPSQPSNRPSTRPSNPNNKPSTRPSNPNSRPSTRPSQQPSTNNRTKNNVYSDKQGNVHKKTDNGWQQRNNNSWSQPSQNNRSNSQMNKSYDNRQRGSQRTQNYNQQRSRSASPSRSSGASRGGGGRRR